MSAPVRIRAEVSPADPSSARFLLDRAIAAEPVTYGSAEDAEAAPLAAALLALDGIERAALHGSAVTLTKAPEANWVALKPAVAAAIRAALPQHEAAPPPTRAVSDDAKLLEAVQKALDGSANPAIARHGGRVDVVAVEDGDVMLRMSGGCQGCAASSATLRDGVERMLRSTVPGIRRIVDVTDHAAGENPYFQRSPGAASPLAQAAPPAALSHQGGAWTVDASHLAARFGVSPDALRAEMRAGRVASTQEVGEGADAGFTRLTIRWGQKLWRALVGPDGQATESLGETAAPEAELAARIRAHLLAADPASLPLTYGALAEALDIRPPHAIRRVATALEATMRDDAAAGRPFLAALVVGRARGGIPAPGFFALAAELGAAPRAGEDERACHARLFADAMARYRAPAPA